MVYIARDQRPELDEHLRPLTEAIGDEPGRLSYALYSLLLAYIGDTPTLATYVEGLGIAEGVKLELYRDGMGRRQDHDKLMHGPIEGAG